MIPSRLRAGRDIRVTDPTLKLELERLWDAINSATSRIPAFLEIRPPEENGSRTIMLEFGKIVRVVALTNAPIVFPQGSIGEKRLFGFAKSGAGTVTFTPNAGILVNGSTLYTRTTAGLVLGWFDGKDYWTT